MERIAPVSGAICVLVGISYITCFIFPSTADVFSLVPLNTILAHFYIWNVVTCGFFETRIFLAALTIFGVYHIGQKLESLWGPKEYITFLVIINLSISVATFFTAYICYVLQMEWMMSQYYTGFLGALAALTVGLKQTLPEAEIGFGSICIRAKYMPFILTTSGVCLDWIVRHGPESKAVATVQGNAPAGSNCPALLYGVIFGWIYLRYYQAKADSSGATQYGDSTDAFAFHTLFPEPLRPVVAPFGNLVYNVVRAIGCCSRWHVQYEEHLKTVKAYEQPAEPFGDSIATSQVPNASTAAAERRRKLALEALEARLKDIKKPPVPEGPSGDSSDLVGKMGGTDLV